MDRKNTILGVEYNIKNAPATVAEALALCGGDEALVVEHFTQKLIYNHHNPEVRAAFVEKLEEVTGNKRKVSVKDTGKKNEDGSAKTVEVYDETETEYFSRVLAELGAEPGDYADLMQEVADATPLDGKRRARTSAGPKLAKMYLTAAQSIVDKGEAAVTKASGILSAELNMEVAPTVEGIAKALKEREDRKRAEFAQSLTALV